MFFFFFFHILGNAKPPEVLSRMIHEAKIIQENQIKCSALLSCMCVTCTEPNDQNVIDFMSIIFSNLDNIIFYYLFGFIES